ncbi:MAG: EAL domain-containing protein [Pseudomonadota bacterium]
MQSNDQIGIGVKAPNQKRADVFRLTREIALVSLISPILFMASLVCAAILLISQGEYMSAALFHWMVSHCLICSSLFLLSLREKSVLFDPQFVPNGELPIHRFFFVSIGFMWGAVPAFIVADAGLEAHYSIASVLAGLIMSATVLLRFMPRVGCAILVAVIAGFALNTFFSPDIKAAAMTLIMMAYFSALLVCSRWYYVRFENRLEQAESAALRTEELNTMLKEVGASADTLLWTSDKNGTLVEIGPNARDHDWMNRFVGTKLFDIFEPSHERELLEARFTRQSESIGIELKEAHDKTVGGRWWKISAKPIYENDQIVGFRGSATDISSLKHWEEKATFLAEYDDLTGLLKRGSFFKCLNTLLDGKAIKSSAEIALIWIDLDRFKWVNDTFGHGGGDEVLVSVAGRLKSLSQSTDIICRYGGDEFAILAVRRGRGSLLRFVKELTAALAEPHQLQDSKVLCSASVGFRRIENSEHCAEQLMQDADLALYAAKAEGRSTWREFSKEFQDELRQKQKLTEDLSDAISNGRMELAYQPIVSSSSGKIIGVEALSRWNDACHGAVSPGEFIRVAEENGLIIALGECVIRKAFQTASRLPENLKISINLSPLQLHSDSLLPVLNECLEQTGTDPANIEIEVTESVFMENNELMMQRLDELRELGFRIVLDDFGTGFSSLSYLQKFSFDKLKLDQSFVREITSNPKSRAIARATISMAHELSVTANAEGIETEAQANFLQTLGCDEFQGYFFERPLTESQLIERLSSERSNDEDVSCEIETAA